MTTTQLPVRITDSKKLREDEVLMAKVDELARKERRTRTMMMRILLEEAIERREAEEARLS